MKRLILLILLAFVGCSSNPVTIIQENSETCLGFPIVQDIKLSCIVYTSNRALFQNIGTEQITLQSREVSVVFSGTLMIEYTEAQIIIAVLEERAVVGANGRTRIIQSGSQVTITFNDDEVNQASDAEPLQALEDIPLERLVRTIPIPEIMATATQAPESAEVTSEMPEATNELVITDESGCVIPRGWNARYIVKRGDILALVAQEQGLTVEQMVEANCLDNPGRLLIGQGLRIPDISPTPIILTTTGGIGFRADNVAIRKGECTMLRWDSIHAIAVYIDDNLMDEANLLEICPEETTIYTLHASMSDGTQIEHSLTISLTP